MRLFDQRGTSRETMRRSIPVLVSTLLTSVPLTLATSYDLAIDVPSSLDGVTYKTNQVVRSDDGIYSADLTLPEDVAVGALHRRPDDVWLFAPSHPVELEGVEYEPRDVVAYDGLTYSSYLDGGSAGSPPPPALGRASVHGQDVVEAITLGPARADQICKLV